MLASIPHQPSYIQNKPRPGGAAFIFQAPVLATYPVSIFSNHNHLCAMVMGKRNASSKYRTVPSGSAVHAVRILALATLSTARLTRASTMLVPRNRRFCTTAHMNAAHPVNQQTIARNINVELSPCSITLGLKRNAIASTKVSKAIPFFTIVIADSPFN